MDKRVWLEVSALVSPESAESVSELFSRYCESGVVVEQGVEFQGVDDHGTPYGPCRVCAYLEMTEAIEDTKRKLSEGLWYLSRIRSDIPEPTFRVVEDQNWMESWRKFYRPVFVGERIQILPSWIEDQHPDRLAIRTEPSMAFGTGTHPTTQLSLLLTEKYVRPGEPFIDVGSGSGILSVAAILLGASEALGIDIDEESMISGKENAQRNGAADRIVFTRRSIPEINRGESDLKLTKAPVVIANILTPILEALFAQGMAELVAPGGMMLLSGILSDQDERIRAAAEARGLVFVERMAMEDWAGYAFRKP